MKRGTAVRGRIGSVLSVCLSLCLAAPAAAQTSASFQVNATIVPGCEINGSPPVAGQNIGGLGTLDFGSHSALATGPVSTSLAPNAGLTLSCTPSVTLTMSLGNGLHAAGVRNLQEPGGGRIAYRLYRDAAFSQETLANQAFSVSFSGAGAIALPIFGRLTLPGNSSPGTYTDTVIVTLAW